VRVVWIYHRYVKDGAVPGLVDSAMQVLTIFNMKYIIQQLNELKNS